MLKDNLSAFNATDYDNKIGAALPYYEEFYEQVIDVVNIHNHDHLKWLDIGCGTGKMAEAAFDKLKIEKFVFCDISTEMIEIVRKRFHYENTEFITASVHDLDYCNEFDVVTAIQVNHYFNRENRLAALKRCYEALRNNGIFITFENFAPYSEAGKRLYLDRWKAYQRACGKSNEECNEHLKRYGINYFPITITEHMQAMEECGFRTSEILWLSYMQAGFIGMK